MKGFRDFFEGLNRDLQNGPTAPTRVPFLAEVIQVTEGCTYLDPVIETAEIQRMVNSHNLALRNSDMKSKSRTGAMHIKRVVFYTGYLVDQEISNHMTQNLLGPLLPSGLAESNDLKYMANSVLITPHPAPRSILDKIGGMGKKLRWRITGIGSLDNRIWAARVAPIPASEPFHTENPLPIVVLAVRKGARLIDAGKIQNWRYPSPKEAMEFDTVIGEKVVLRVEELEQRTLNRGQKRALQHEQDDHANLVPNHNSGYDGPSHGRGDYHHSHRGVGDGGYDNTRGRGGPRGRGRGGGRGRGNNHRGRGRGRGRGDYYQYKSLDDHGPSHDAPHEGRGGYGGGAPRDGYSMDY